MSMNSTTTPNNEGSRMDKKLKVKWVEALRSGKYEQGRHYLESEGRYCCLGVLRAIAPDLFKKMSPLEAKFLRVHFDGPSLVVPHVVQDQLATLNDEDVPFEMIAGLIHEAL